MLSRAVRAQCRNAPLVGLGYATRPRTRWSPLGRLAAGQLRALSSKDDQKGGKQKKEEKGKQSNILTNTNVGVKEQRKADWAILKEMAKYLWPKVCMEHPQLLSIC